MTPLICSGSAGSSPPLISRSTGRSSAPTTASRPSEGTEAIRLLARTEAVFLDPVYSGKAMAALISHVRAGALDPNEAVIFLHTGGGPSLFATGTTLV